jgi:hypothetical protein
LIIHDRDRNLPALGNGMRVQKISEITIMETIERKVRDVAEPDQIASGMAGTGLKNISWSAITRGLVAVDIGDLDVISCTNFRWIRRLQRQIARLKERKKARTAKHPVIRRGVWQ